MKPLHVLRPYYDKAKILKEIEATLESGWTGDGGKTVEFENKWGELTGWEHNSYVNSCTAALHLAILAIRDSCPTKTEVIVPDITFVSTAAVVKQTGLDLVLCDVNESLILDIEKLEKAITAKTLAIFYVGIGGNTKGLKDIERLCVERGIKLIIDAAHMGGTSLENGMKLSTVNAEFCCYSFQAVKNLGIADSGMISFNQDYYKNIVKRYRWMGISQTTYERTVGDEKQKTYKWEYEIDRLGYKYNGNALMAACCLGILEDLEKNNEYRRKIRSWYQTNLRQIEGIEFIHHENEDYTSAHLAQVIMKSVDSSSQRNKIISALNEREIYPGVHYRPLSMSSYYKQKHEYCKNSIKYSERLISLPCHLGITEEDVKRICTELEKHA